MRLKRIQKTLVISGLVLFLLIAAAPLFAQSPMDSLNSAASGTGVINQPITYVVAVMVRNVLGIIGVIFLILIVYGGTRWMTSGGNEQHISLAKKVLTASVIGLVIVMTGYSVTYFIIQNLTNQQTQSLPTQGGA